MKNGTVLLQRIDTNDKVSRARPKVRVRFDVRVRVRVTLAGVRL